MEYFKEKRAAKINELKDQKLKLGKLFQHGDNLTICGNPVAMLMAVTRQSYLDENCFRQFDDRIQCCTSRFPEGEMLAGFRSPHNSPNNIVYLENVYPKRVKKYFPDLGDNVIIINGIGTDVQSRLNGQDLDTDSIYTTNQENIVLLARKAYAECPTIINGIKYGTNELANKYISLSEAVKTDADAKEDLLTTQTELLKKLGLEGESVDDLIAKYGSPSNAIRQAGIDSLKNSQIDLIAGIDAAREELLDVAKDSFWGTNNTITATGKDAAKAFQELGKAGIVSSSSYGSAGGSMVLIDDGTVDGALENFGKLEDAIEALRDSGAFTAEELSENSLFKAIYGRYSEMKNEVDAYRPSIENLNRNLSQQTMLTALQGREIPKTEEAFSSFRQELIDAAVDGKQFIGNEKEISDAINN